MSNELPRRAEEIAARALKKFSPDKWDAYLEGACGDDQRLLQSVKELLHQQLPAALAPQVAALKPPANINRPQAAERPGTRIGPYKLLQQIGEGGFGVVYMAEQQRPVHRKVALKIIKPGMDTREVIARFEAERQALAMMDHPHIARVLDAGATSSGRPYFVMELVRGIPITEYCDQGKLTPGQRMELFIDVCLAVQHAHHKGIIHRDIKPSNVMVTLHDGRPVVKVIDFGVAKAIGQRLTEKTLFTNFEQMVGTPLYMSPEQAEMSGLDIDTRTDIYSLGVLLYELLTGTTPLDRERIRQAAFDEIRQIIREEEPPKPSTRISTLGETLSGVSAHRQTEPKKLSALLRGDLDWIVMRALEKDRARRYETANALANDVRRYLSDEPVAARPPSAAYRFHKYARRNKAALLTALLIAAALLVGTVASTWQAVLATRAAYAERLARDEAIQSRRDEARQRQAAEQARQRAEREKASAEQARRQEASLRQEAQRQRRRAEANFAQARSAVDASLEELSKSDLLNVPGLEPLRRELLQSALAFYQDVAQSRSDAGLDRRAELAATHLSMGNILAQLGQTQMAQQSHQQALDYYRQLRQSRGDDRTILMGLARACLATGSHQESLELCRLLLEQTREDATCRGLLATTYDRLARASGDWPQQAIPWARQSLRVWQRLLDEEPQSRPYLVELDRTAEYLGGLLTGQGRAAEAVTVYRSSTARLEPAHAEAPRTVSLGRRLALTQQKIARAQLAQADAPRALQSLQDAVAVWRRLVAYNPAVPELHSRLHVAYRALSQQQQAAGQDQAAADSLHTAENVIQQLPRETADDYYRLAAVHACLSSPETWADVRGGNGWTEQEQQQHTQQAIACLRQAFQSGYGDLSVLHNDAHLAAIVQQPEVQQLLSSWKQAAGAGPQTDGVADVSSAPAWESNAALAAAQHAIGQLQFGMKQFETANQSLSKALEIRQSLVEQFPQQPDFRAAWGDTQIHLGYVDWQLEQFSEALGKFDAGLRGFQAADTSVTDSGHLSRRRAQHELEIARRYASIGLWDQATDWTAQVVQRVEPWSEAWPYRSTVLLALAGKDELYRQHCQKLDQLFRGQNVGHTAHLLWVNALVPQPVIPVEEYVQLAEKTLKEAPDDRWLKQLAAAAHYRAGSHDEALQRLQQAPDTTTWGEWKYLRAMVHHQLGHADEAQWWLAHAESRYRQLALQYLRTDLREIPLVWWKFAQIRLARQEAWALMQPEQIPHDPWTRLIRGRSLAWLGKTDEAHEELEAAVNMDRQNFQLWITRAHVFAQLGWEREAQRDFQTALERFPSEPRVWIARGRYRAERGEHQAADADFAQAAATAPQQLQHFLQAGWWIAGPYPSRIDQSCPPETNLDPAQVLPLMEADGQAKAEPVRWRSTFVWEPEARVKLRQQLDGASKVAAYALTYVYSDEQRPALLRFASDGPRRLWLNGELVHESKQYSPEWYGDRVAVTLRAGRNQLLVKISETRGWLRFFLRFVEGRSSSDTALELAERAQWRQAADQLREVPPVELIEHTQAASVFAGILLLSDEFEAYDRLRKALLVRHGQTTNAARAEWIARACLFRPAEAEMVKACRELASQALEAKATAWRHHAMALVHYRAGELPEALDQLQKGEQVDPDWKGRALNWLLLAMVHHKMDHHDEALRWWQKAGQQIDQQSANAPAYAAKSLKLFPAIHDTVECLLLQREAVSMFPDAD